MADPKHLENCYSALGLRDSATDAEIEAAYRDVCDLLQSDRVPARLRRWAAIRQADVDAAYAILTDPGQRYAPTNSRRKEGAGQAPTVTPPARRPAGTAGGAKAQPPRTHQPGPSIDSAAPTLARSVKAAVLAIGLVALLGSGYLIYQNGQHQLEASAPITAAAPAGESISQGPEIVPLDPARVAELEARVSQDPNDGDALFELGESHFQAQEWQKAIDWFTKLVAVQPQHVHALTDIGTANLNLGRDAAAKEAWMKALAVDPDDPQVHYNLGFLYARTEPPDLQAAIAEWETVVELAPDSSLAQVARAHLEGLK